MTRTCPCGTVLSRYNPDPVCAQCAAREPEPGPAVDLDYLVAGILLEHAAVHGQEPLYVQAELEYRGVVADCWQVQEAVKHAASRIGLIADGARDGRGGLPGYVLRRWEEQWQEMLEVGA